MRAAELMVGAAAALYEAGRECGAEANMAKLLAADASWAAADMCLQTHGGFGFAEEFDVERKFRETRLYQTAPSTSWACRGRTEQLQHGKNCNCGLPTRQPVG